MTPKYWFRIIFGMLAIFVVGMLIRSGIHKGRRAIGEVTHGSGPITVPLLGMAFKLGDERLGSLQRLRIEREGPKHVSAFRLFATLDNEASASKFDGCRLTVTDAHDIDEHTTFSCVSDADSTSEPLVEFGSVTMQPGGREFALYIPESVRADLQKDDGEDTGDKSDSGNVEINSGAGGFDLKVNGKSVVSSKFDSAGGRLVVNGENGKRVVDMKVTAPAKAPAAPKAATPPPAKKP